MVSGGNDIPVHLELGCGNKKPSGFYGVDIRDTESVDLVQNLDQPEWNLPLDHFKRIRAIDLFEHLKQPTQFMDELWKVATPDSTITIRGPHLSSSNWHDPTHERLLGSRSFNPYAGENGVGPYADETVRAPTRRTFDIVDYEIQFQWQRTPLKQIGHVIANRQTFTYETTALRNLFPATNIEFEIKPVK
jgi:2-polyprenyl-3-methyl-5-hydroxy-6-metoxy-1,4-benzoquinol methylase